MHRSLLAELRVLFAILKSILINSSDLHGLAAMEYSCFEKGCPTEKH